MLKRLFRQTLKKIYLFNISKKLYNLSINWQRRLYNYLFPTAKILLYHRVANSNDDPHNLCVSPENFQKQMEYLKENFKIIPLVQLVQNIRTKGVQNNSIIITFDDGYADNLHNALPILEEFNVPATIFLTAGYVSLNKPFYWDENTTIKNRGWPMSAGEAKTLSNNSLIEIGGHTINHPKLAKLPENEQIKEINRGKQILEEILSAPLSSFAYPFGGKDSFNKTTIKLVKKAGFNYACSNIHERVKNSSDIFALPRYVIRNWNLEEFKKEFKKFI